MQACAVAACEGVARWQSPATGTVVCQKHLDIIKSACEAVLSVDSGVLNNPGGLKKAPVTG